MGITEDEVNNIKVYRVGEKRALVWDELDGCNVVLLNNEFNIIRGAISEDGIICVADLYGVKDVFFIDRSGVVKNRMDTISMVFKNAFIKYSGSNRNKCKLIEHYLLNANEETCV